MAGRLGSAIQAPMSRIGRFLARVGRFFGSWLFLKIVLGTVALIVLFYMEEDWRGAHAWAAAKAKWESRGGTIDLAKLVPEPVPDDKNLAAIPIFKLQPDPAIGGALEPVALDRAMRQGLPGGNIPLLGNWARGVPPDMAKIRAVVAADSQTAFPGAAPSPDDLAQVDALYPVLADLRAAAVQRPFFRPNVEYLASPPDARSVGPVTAGITLSRLLTLHAVLALNHHQPDLALEDIEVNHIVLSGVQRDPSLVGGLVAVGMAAINNTAVYYGLTRHAWTDAQLIELQHMFGSTDFLAPYQFDLRAETGRSAANFDYFAGRRNPMWGQVSNRRLPWMVRFSPPWPAGWWKENKSELAAFLFHNMAVVDSGSRRVFPDIARDLNRAIDSIMTQWDAHAPWKILFTVSAQPFANAAQKFAQAQVWNDEARMACALERYWLAHHTYPTSLDALTPLYIEGLPHDIITGQPYHYSLRPDGTYLLYSVGWNQTDDGGQVVMEKERPNSIDYEQGDWVWPTPK